ncbi:MAG: ROK family protein [Flavobacteriia bacterium]|nr:ROK family protein [Flavobacteriia bacterium]
MIEHVALGVDIGGTNTAFGIVDKQGNVLFEESVSTRQFHLPEQLVTEIYNRVSDTPWFEAILGIGIGAPNGNVFTGNIEFAPNLEWKGIVAIADLFEQKFHRPAILANDANAAAVGEHLFGCAKDLTDFVTITLGTGLGSGIFIDGSLIVGHQGFAGEYGHIRVINNGRLCGCGRHGCLETYASSTGVVRSIAELNSPNKAVSTIHEHTTAKEVFMAAEKGDVFANEIIEYTAEILGSALADFAAFSNPKAYVLFGGLAQSGEKFAQKVKHYLEKNALKIYQDEIEIRISALHDKNAAVLGTAASLFWKSINKR